MNYKLYYLFHFFSANFAAFSAVLTAYSISKPTHRWLSLRKTYPSNSKLNFNTQKITPIPHNYLHTYL